MSVSGSICAFILDRFARSQIYEIRLRSLFTHENRSPKFSAHGLISICLSSTEITAKVVATTKATHIAQRGEIHMLPKDRHWMIMGVDHIRLLLLERHRVITGIDTVMKSKTTATVSILCKAY